MELENARDYANVDPARGFVPAHVVGPVDGGEAGATSRSR